MRVESDYINRPIVSITDEWLGDDKRRWEEIDEALELRVDGRRMAIQVEAMCRVNTARLMAYAQLYGEYESLRQGYAAKEAMERSKYDQEKSAIETGNLAKNDHKKQVRERWVAHQSVIEENGKKSHNAEKIEKLILKKATGDVFGIKEKASLADVAAVKPSLAFGDFVKGWSEYMSSNLDGNLLANCNYKKSNDLAKNTADLEVLTTSVEAYAYGTAEQKLLASGHMRLLANRATWQASKRSFEVSYPYLTLLHDTMAAVLVKSDERTWRELGNIIDLMMSDKVNSPNFDGEIKKLNKNYAIEAVEARKQYRDYSSDGLKDLLEQLEKGVNVADVPEHAKRRVTSDTARYTAVLDVAAFLRNHPACVEMYKLMILHTYNQLPIMAEGDLKRNELIAEIYTYYPHAAILAEAGVTLDLRSAISMGRSFFEQRNYSNGGEKKYFILSAVEGDKGQKNEYFGYKPKYELEDMQIEKKSAENEWLWEQILDYSMWFVSPRGDRFLTYDKGELANFGLNAITFGIDREHPREHILKLAISNGQQMELRLDVEKNLLGPQREVIYTDPRVKTVLLNEILKRLYFITSGMLATAQIETKTDYPDEGESVEYRRAHYRVLTSTPQHPITMESEGAKSHARIIREKYGISIAAETYRRRVKGILETNQFLTFVQEVVPANLGRSSKPNDISYEEDKIVIPV